MSVKPRTRFCWHCSKQFRGNHFTEYETENGTVFVHKECLEILSGGFDHKARVDTPAYDGDSDRFSQLEIYNSCREKGEMSSDECFVYSEKTRRNLERLQRKQNEIELQNFKVQ